MNRLALKKKKRSTAIFFFLSVLLAGIVVSIAAIAWLHLIDIQDTLNQNLKAIHRPTRDNTIIYDRNEKVIGELFQKYHLFTPFEKIPKQLIDAIVAVEDKNFFGHFGVDVSAMARAAWISVRELGFSQGASTITQQLVRREFLSNEKTLERKAKEIALSIRLESILSKQEIMERYCNLMFLGNGAYGVGAAAKRYFGTSLQQLKIHQLALIAGLFQSPSHLNPHRYPRRAKKRQLSVLKAMVKNRMLSKQDYFKIAQQPLEYKNYQSARIKYAPYFIDHVERVAKKILKKESIADSGYRIYTTLDVRLQTLANKTFTRMDKHFRKADALVQSRRKGRNASKASQAAMLTVDPKSGGILAMVGGRSYKTSKFNRTTMSKRSPGSAIKPAIYSLALQRGMRWSDMILVAPISIDNYRPKNSRNSFLSEVTLLRSFYKSLNTTTVELSQKIGIRAILEHMKKLGIRTPLKKELGTALGSSSVTMLDLARMYSVFANSGELADTISITKIEDRDGTLIYEAPSLKERSTKVLDYDTAFLMVDGMQHVLRRGTGASAAEFSNKSGGKTGTSDRSEDNWFAGFTNQLVTIVWVGTDDHTPMLGRASGAHLALPIWEGFMSSANQILPPNGFSVPDNIESAVVDSRYGHLTDDGIRMFFRRGRSPEQTSSDLDMVKTSNFRNIFEY